MTLDELWRQKYQEVVAFIEKNKRNLSRYDDEERGKYCNWLKHNRRLYAMRAMKEDRVEKFGKFLEMTERYRRVNQYM